MTTAPVQVLIFGAGQLALDIADMIGEMPGMALAGFIEGIERGRCHDGKSGLPVYWIDDGITLGAGSYVTAGAVVTRDFPDHSRLAGFPARAIRPKG
mgnify:CR=1 FL=1|jgi:hypothetical protein|tara:strand:+ start:129 stop:419 length:291 start_codon:yes stop_codon:yes gene_type:complete